MTWYDILTTITNLTELAEFTVVSCSNALKCNFKHTTSNRYRSDTLHDPFEYAELIVGNNQTTLALTLQAESAREEYAMRMLSLGKPIDIDMVSPTMIDGNGSSSNLGWERKYSLCFEIGDCPIWFGIEETHGRKNLVNVTIHCSY